MKNTISHQGRVLSVEKDHARVLIVQSSACATCEAHKLCQSSERKEKVVDVFHAPVERLSVGQVVTVEASLGMGIKATVLAYVLPLAVLVAVLATVIALSGDEVKGSLAALGSLVPYYLVLYLLRDKISRKIIFKITNI